MNCANRVTAPIQRKRQMEMGQKEIGQKEMGRLLINSHPEEERLFVMKGFANMNS